MPMVSRLLIHVQPFIWILFSHQWLRFEITYLWILKAVTSRHSFKFRLNFGTSTKPKYYLKTNVFFIHESIWTNCSSLNTNLFTKGITDSSLMYLWQYQKCRTFLFWLPFTELQRITLTTEQRRAHRAFVLILISGIVYANLCQNW